MILLYGPPASGKDTITQALTQHDDRYRLFHRVKCGPGRVTTYRMVTASRLKAIRSMPGEVLWENSRYGATYIVDRSHLAAMFAQNIIPVIHLGQAQAIPSIVNAMPQVDALTVALACPRPVAEARINARRTGDTHARLLTYDATDRLAGADLTIDTSAITPDQAAQRIAHRATVPRHTRRGRELPPLSTPEVTSRQAKTRRTSQR